MQLARILHVKVDKIGSYKHYHSLTFSLKLPFDPRSLYVYMCSSSKEHSAYTFRGVKIVLCESLKRNYSPLCSSIKAETTSSMSNLVTYDIALKIMNSCKGPDQISYYSSLLIFFENILNENRKSKTYIINFYPNPP